MKITLLILLGLLMRAPIAHADGEFRIGLGSALNNRNPPEWAKTEDGFRGQAYDLAAVWHDTFELTDLQLAWTFIAKSDFGTEQAVTMTFLRKTGPFQAGAGLILGYTQGYAKWVRENHIDDARDWRILTDPRQCTFCGVVAQVGYEYKRAQFQVRYWRTDFNLHAGHNGALVFVTWRLP